MAQIQCGMEIFVTNALDVLAGQHRKVIIDILSEKDLALLDSLRSHERPTSDEQEQLTEILADAFSENLGPGHIPTDRGVLIDNALGDFLTQWPAEKLSSQY